MYIASNFSGLFSLFSIRKVLAPAGPGRKHPERCVEQHLSQSIAYTRSVESDWFSQHSIRRQFHDRTAQPKLTSREGIYFLISVPKSEIKFFLVDETTAVSTLNNQLRPVHYLLVEISNSNENCRTRSVNVKQYSVTVL